MLAEIEQSRRAFEREQGERAFLLAIRYSWHRLSLFHHQDVRRRYGWMSKSPPPRNTKLVQLGADDWRRRHFRFDKNGRPLSDVGNALVALSEDPALSGIVGLSLDRGATVLKGPLPFAFRETFTFKMRELKQTDLTSLLEYLQWLGLCRLTRDDCLEAVRAIALENVWSPR